MLQSNEHVHWFTPECPTPFFFFKISPLHMKPFCFINLVGNEHVGVVPFYSNSQRRCRVYVKECLLSVLFALRLPTLGSSHKFKINISMLRTTKYINAKYNHKAGRIKCRILTVYTKANSLEFQNISPNFQLFLSPLMKTN